ncbi:platelet glycoprotein Ib alpha chain-like isoform X2 [Sebastes umbrosus]|uniref:platelet glycoprotein Ib alpha chain-like isoform X2 n=1 Tax=Sebastes umbrosus TaxID=72105 RepID=UPI00189CB7FA|nr:platelet glycoprotein Ib alpha chain-like isoform X2 [Sebastes umbrosus]
MPDDWFSQKEEVPYLFLSANPWECSCSIFYFLRYLDEFDFNVYVRNGPIIKTDVKKVVCDSPPFHQGKPLIELEEDDLCSTEEEYDPIGPTTTVPILTPVPTTPITTTAPTPTTATSTATPAFVVESSTEHHRVVTRYQTFTRSGSRGDGPLVRLHTEAPRPPLPTVRPSTESPANMLTATPTKPRSAPSTVTSTTPKQRVVTTTATTKATITKATTIEATTTTAPSRAVRGAGVFCFWLDILLSSSNRLFSFGGLRGGWGRCHGNHTL